MRNSSYVNTRGWMALVVALSIPGLSGCASGIPKGALVMDTQTLEVRQLSTRRFMTGDESRILAASAGLLQDLGFNIDESETSLGLIVASKDRSAVEAGQVATKLLFAALGVQMAIDKTQKLKVSIVTRPKDGGISVRVTFQRIVWNEYGQVSKLEMLNDVKFYQEFFDKLSKSVFLEAHRL